ncbi:MAG: hypothetical protein Q8M40_09815 [Legionella sp.]|nr:hypothetical protein [Legionella sp.]
MKSLKLIIATSLFAFILSGCNEGPAEKKGKQIDNTIENVKNKIQDKGPAQKAGEKLDEATGN